MNSVFLVFSSVTFALKAKNVLEEKGIRGKVEKLKEISVASGCGYGVKIDMQNKVDALRVLKRYNIKIIDVVYGGRE